MIDGNEAARRGVTEAVEILRTDNLRAEVAMFTGDQVDSYDIDVLIEVQRMEIFV
jgi:hypothetical protein